MNEPKDPTCEWCNGTGYVKPQQLSRRETAAGGADPVPAGRYAPGAYKCPRCDGKGGVGPYLLLIPLAIVALAWAGAQ